MSPIQAVAKIILYVQDMPAQVRFYRDVLGLKMKHLADNADFTQAYWIEFETGDCTLVLHGGGQGRQGADAPKIAFAVADIHDARQMLLKRGAQVGEVRSPAPGVFVCDGVDPEGNFFSIDAHL